MSNFADRVAWIDVAKGVAMVAIVVGHLDISYIDRLVYPWHVPLFFIVAGFFLSQKSTTALLRVELAAHHVAPAHGGGEVRAVFGDHCHRVYHVAPRL